CLIFWSRLTAPQVVQADVRDDAVKPGVKAALETEAMEIAIDFEKCFLVNVPGVLWTLHEVQRQAEDIAVIAADEFLKSSAVTGLRFHDKRPLVKLGQSSHRGQSGLGSGSLAESIRQSQTQSRKRHIRFLFALADVMVLIHNTLAQVRPFLADPQAA